MVLGSGEKIEFEAGDPGTSAVWRKWKPTCLYKESVEGISRSRFEKQMGKTDDTSHPPVLPLQNFTLYNEYGDVMCGEMKGE